MHPTQKVVQMTSAQVRTPADFVSHNSLDVPWATHESEDADVLRTRSFLLHAQVVLSSSIRPFVLPSLPLILFCYSDASHYFLFVLVLSDVTARCIRMSNRHLLIISVSRVPRAHPLLLAQLELFTSLWLALSQRFCIVRIHPCFSVKVLSMIVPIISRHSSSCGFVAFPCDGSAAHLGQPPVCPWASISADNT